MLDAKGDTGVYLIYAYVRICSILRKAGFDEATSNTDDFNFSISSKSERDLALTLLRLPEAVEVAARDLTVNRVADQLHSIAVKVGEFYVHNRVLGSAEEKSRVALLLATKRVMEICFSLLGMKTLNRI